MALVYNDCLLTKANLRLATLYLPRNSLLSYTNKKRVHPPSHLQQNSYGYKLVLHLSSLHGTGTGSKIDTFRIMKFVLLGHLTNLTLNFRTPNMESTRYKRAQLGVLGYLFNLFKTDRSDQLNGQVRMINRTGPILNWTRHFF